MSGKVDAKSWVTKFKNAFRGIRIGVQGQNSFVVHVPMAIIIMVLALVLRLALAEILILLLCIALVLVCELFNSALEKIGQSITSEYDENIRDALDIASGTVLTMSIFSAIIGSIVFISAIF